MWLFSIIWADLYWQCLFWLSAETGDADEWRSSFGLIWSLVSTMYRTQDGRNLDHMASFMGFPFCTRHNAGSPRDEGREPFALCFFIICWFGDWFSLQFLVDSCWALEIAWACGNGHGWTHERRLHLPAEHSNWTLPRQLRFWVWLCPWVVSD